LSCRLLCKGCRPVLLPRFREVFAIESSWKTVPSFFFFLIPRSPGTPLEFPDKDGRSRPFALNPLFSFKPRSCSYAVPRCPYFPKRMAVLCVSCPRAFEGFTRALQASRFPPQVAFPSPVRASVKCLRFPSCKRPVSSNGRMESAPIVSFFPHNLANAETLSFRTGLRVFLRTRSSPSLVVPFFPDFLCSPAGERNADPSPFSRCPQMAERLRNCPVHFPSTPVLDAQVDPSPPWCPLVAHGLLRDSLCTIFSAEDFLPRRRERLTSLVVPFPALPPPLHYNHKKLVFSPMTYSSSNF